MAGQLQEITGYFVREFQRWDSVAMCSVESPNGDVGPDEITVKVECDEGELIRDQEYRFVGTWKNHPKYGRQFHASSFSLVIPHGRAGVIAYLCHAGEGLRFGPVRAAALWEEFGGDAVAVAREQPGKVVECLQKRRLKIDHSAAVNLAARLQDDARLESCTLDLMDLLAGRGFYRTLPRLLIKEWGARAASIVKRDPLRMVGKFPGCGFKRCDALYLQLGLDPNRMKRQAMAAWYAVASDSEGHTWYFSGVAEQFVTREIGGTNPQPKKAVKRAVRRGHLSELTTDGASGPVTHNGSGSVRWVAQRKDAENEREIAESVARAMGEGVKWPV